MTASSQGKDPQPFVRHLEDPESAVDSAHALFEELERKTPSAQLSTSLIDRARLAVHEWLANLAQHADFPERAAEVVLTVKPGQQQLTCVIEDNSTGLDLRFQGLDTNFRMAERPPGLQPLPERGMGLALIRACAHELSYERLGPDRHQLTLCIRADFDA